ncbi:MAG TPA: glycoside hydrolase family 44 protein, partial [Verrucomicrobiae bacterium]|nr:glycoside hydrolase family 44 protein [Verrucomicrobiae bacterium]
AGSNDLKQLNAPLNRQGGNATSSYNWQLNADNRASDYYFASLGYDSATPGEHGDSFIAESRAGGAEPSLTIPMLDWVANLGASRARFWSYSIAKYGPQQKADGVDGWPDMGNGVRTDGSLIVTNDPNDANVPAGPAFQQGWLNHLTSIWGHATNGGLRYYNLDNEPGIWHSTHQDVHPNGATMGEIFNKMTNYAAHIKSTDPGALVLGPEEWHYYGAIYSGADSQFEGDNGYPNIFPDRTAHGGLDVYPFLLQSLASVNTNTGRRLLDVCTIHYYPQGGEFSDDVSTSTQLLRNQSTRSLWDSNYVDQSWLADDSRTRIIKLIPQLKQWIATNYPGTLIGITEYNWGAESSINGATAQADVLGIFGREGLDLAERWTIPPTNSPTFKAMQLYRNYDFNKSTFGDTSVSASVPNPDDVSAFAALRSTDGALTIMAINKQIGSNAPVTIALTNFPSTGIAQVWQLTSANIINHLTNFTFTGSVFTNTLPAQSVTLFVLPVAASPRLRIDSLGLGNTFHFWLDGQQSLRYIVSSSSNLLNWSALQTNTLASNSVLLNITTTNALRFYRAQWLQ